MSNCLQIKCLISKEKAKSTGVGCHCLLHKEKGSDTKKKQKKIFIFLKGKNISANSKGISKKIIIGHNGYFYKINLQKIKVLLY